MRLIVLALILFAPVAFAHPLDDRAQMTSEVVIVSDQRLEYVLHFRYLDAIASISEISGRLDADNDGLVTAPELKRRFNALVDELAFPVTLRVDGEPIVLTPEVDRFLFQDMNRTGPLDLEAGVPTDTLRIHYRFVFSWEAPQPLAAGEHTVEYSFNSGMTVISAITEQMVAFDARENVRARINEVSHTSVGIPTMAFKWIIEAPVTPPEPDKPLPPTVLPAPTAPVTEPETPPNVPAWITLVAGLAVVVAGIASLIRRNPQRKGVGGLLVVIAGVAIVVAALTRLGYITT